MVHNITLGLRRAFLIAPELIPHSDLAVFETQKRMSYPVTTFISVFQRNIQRIRDLVKMEEEDRRALLRTLTDDEYRDVMNVCAIMPNIQMIIKSEGKMSDKNYM